MVRILFLMKVFGSKVPLFQSSIFWVVKLFFILRFFIQFAQKFALSPICCQNATKVTQCPTVNQNVQKMPTVKKLPSNPKFSQFPCSLIAKKLPKFAQCPKICPMPNNLHNTQQFAQYPKVCSQETQMFAYCVNDCQYSKIYKTLICRKNSISLALARIFSSPQATMQSFFCSI